MGDGKTVNSPVFEDLGTEPSITLVGRAQRRTSPAKEKDNTPITDEPAERLEAHVSAGEDKLRAAGFRLIRGAWRR